MTFESGFILAAIIHIGVLGVSLYLYWQNRHYALTLHEIERFGISAGQGEVPTIVMEAERPVEIILPKGKKLWVRALPVSQARRWRQEFLVFYASNLASLEMLPFLSADQTENKELTNIMAKDFATAFIKGGMQSQVIRLLKRTLLSVSICNPGKVSARWIAKHCSEIKIAEMLLVVYAYNNGAYIKKNLQRMLEGMGSISLGMNGTPLHNAKTQEKGQTGIGQPLFPDSPFAPGREQKEQPGKNESLTECASDSAIAVDQKR
jgi:hypothetical protein